jgi:predicted nuclease of restriction endonuclease-like (RecB) superfamily
MAKASKYGKLNSDIIAQPEYKAFVHEIKQRIKSSQAKAAVAVNSSLIHLYWSIGKLIAEKQTVHSWGTNIVEQLSIDLKTEFPGISGFSARNLWDTRRFYLFYNAPIWRQLVAELNFVPDHNTLIAAKQVESSEDQSLIILRQAVAEIPWGHHLLILNKISDPTEAFFTSAKPLKIIGAGPCLPFT